MLATNSTALLVHFDYCRWADGMKVTAVKPTCDRFAHGVRIQTCASDSDMVMLFGRADDNERRDFIRRCKQMRLKISCRLINACQKAQAPEPAPPAPQPRDPGRLAQPRRRRGQ